eukprot:CAMPEP_0205803804 /NCGR_PEP_ID=MMETSP0205-20121125/6550_1 /ASSEMBLY_ACC=CAM_ASM_000278 /TAXON_ID=36767 /ORGANISM="Euplotes focardii, Strain TN1" /LENGTH=79 /DNA_ID=CAMNT_0053072433 /DNA_START=172 /DNA_END=411 /DNA_ORIENTATION=-
MNNDNDNIANNARQVFNFEQGQDKDNLGTSEEVKVLKCEKELQQFEFVDKDYNSIEYKFNDVMEDAEGSGIHLPSYTTK